MHNPAADPKAVDLARQFRQAIDADCVILFGSRARGDWSNQSDVDLMVLCPNLPDQDTVLDIQDKAAQMTQALFPRTVPVDVIFLTHTDFISKSEHTVNNVAARARREGVIMPRNPEEYSYSYNDDDNLEYQETQLRISDANLHYHDMHLLLDNRSETKNTAYHAQQTLEHAMKALISALGHEYHTHHETRNLATDIRHLDPSQEWQFASNLGQLDNFAGGTRYAPALTPIEDFREMANNVTDDLDLIYQRIQAITGEDPWDVLPDGTNQPVQPRWRPES